MTSAASPTQIWFLDTLLTSLLLPLTLSPVNVSPLTQSFKVLMIKESVSAESIDVFACVCY